MRKPFATLLALTMPFGCTPNDAGMLEATTTGDLSHALAPHERADAPLVEQCGKVINRDDAGVIVRLPYLQKTTSKSTSIMWAEAPGAGVSAVVTTPKGRLVADAKPQIDEPKESALSDRMLARVTGLDPDTVYCYTLRDRLGQALIGPVGFRTAPTPGSGRPTRFAVIGDSGDGTTDQEALAQQIGDVPFDFLLHVGDIAYSNGEFAEFQANYFDIYSDILEHFSVYAVPGNHEYRSPDAAPFRALFDLPNNERYYSFEWGDVHFVGLDTEQLGAKQEQWLEADLRKNQKPWTVAFLHKPPYSSGWHGSDDEVQSAFAPIFARFRVPIVFSGHDHHYERTKPQNGVTYIVTGGGGAGTYPVTPSDFSAVAEEVVQFMYVTADESQLSVHAIDGTGSEFDQVVFER